MTTRSDPDPTIAHYDANASQYEADTMALDIEHLYRPFLQRVPAGGRILDLGCGPGRDMRAFSAKGYEVVGVDASAAMVERARRNTSCVVHRMTFFDIPWTDEFDGVWACASLLHAPLAELESTLRRVRCALRPGGVIYASFKTEHRASAGDARQFTILSEAQLSRVVEAVGGLNVEELWRTTDVRAQRANEAWLNVLLRRTEWAGR